MLGIAAACQLATVMLTWPLWQVRQSPPQLPVFSLIHLSFGPAVVASLAVAVAWPRVGVLLHGLVLVTACVWDQFRIQPQFLVLWILMLGCSSQSGAWLARWFLASMWLWAGLHKFFSPDWFGPVGWTLLERAGFEPAGALPAFTLAIAASETALGLATVFAPRYASLGCLLVHGGILVFLSPWLADYNPSVWPWNLGLACVGTWLLAWGNYRRPQGTGQWLLVSLILAIPAAYYVGWLEAHLAHVLYSENMPKGWIVTARGLEPIVGWEEVNVPFPDSHRLSVRYFAQVAHPGDKLMIDDPRHWVRDGYYKMDAERSVVSIEREEFLTSGPTTGGVAAVAGIEPDNRLAQYHLMRLGARTRLDQNQMWEVVELEGPRVTDDDLAWLVGLPSLRTIVLRGTPITDRGLERMHKLRSLKKVILHGTLVTAEGVRALGERLPGCQVEYFR
jgi:uncharacterized membrane protein YphA (DoxX/SURF4 family)